MKHPEWLGDRERIEKLLRRTGLMISSVESIEQYLDENYDRLCIDDTTVGEFAYYNPYGTFLVTMLGHIVCIKDGEVIDTFDCTDRIMWCAWEVV